MRIMYVEDNDANLHLVKRVARMGNHQVMNYFDGQAALVNFEHDKPDLVLMDIHLSGDLDGLEVVRRIREKGIQTPIFALTAYAMAGDEARCMEAGCNGYLAKPVPIDKLVEIIQQHDPGG